MADETKSFRKIIINGKEIAGPESVPEFLRQFVQDANKNGVPDMMEQFLNNPMVKKAMERAGDQLQNLTPDQRAKIEKLMGKLGGMMDGQAGGTPTINIATASMGGDSSSATTSFSSSTSSGAVSFGTPSSAPRIDYKALGIEDPDRKSSFPTLLIVALVGVIIVLAGVLLLRGHL